jgi:hypothetical protein
MTKPLLGLTYSDEGRFWLKVFRSTEDKCWEWAEHTDEDGYGRFNVHSTYVRANRAAYYFENRVDPGDLKVCHTCDNPPCCNPKHLFLGTALDNNLDAIRKGRGSSKLKENQIEEIRYKGLIIGYQVNMLAKDYGLNERNIRRILNYESWKHVK